MKSPAFLLLKLGLRMCAPYICCITGQFLITVSDKFTCNG